MSRISHRLNKIEGYFSNFSHSDSDKINIKQEIEKGALMYPSIPFKYSDSGSDILVKIKKNLFLAYSEIEVQTSDKKNIEERIALSKIISDFINPYKEETIKKLQSQIDWAKNFKGSYLFYDTMLSKAFTSSINGFFDPKLALYKFCDALDYNTFMSSFTISSTATDINGITLATGNDGLHFRGSSRSGKLTIEFNVKTSASNYGCAIRSNTPMNIYSTNSTEYDSLNNNGNTVFSMTIGGIYDGKLYNYDFDVSLSVFILSSKEFYYETSVIPSSKLKNRIKIKKDYNNKVVNTELKTLLSNEGEVLEISKSVDLAKTDGIIYELNEDDILEYEYVNLPSIADLRNIGPHISAKYANIKADLTFNKPETVFLGLNSFKKTGKKESITNTISNNGSSTFLVKELYSKSVGTGIKTYDIPLTIVVKNNPFVISQVENENKEMVDCKQFIFFGKLFNENIFINEHMTTYRTATGVSTALSKNRYTTTYDSDTNMTTVIISSTANPESISYAVSLVSLLIKPSNLTQYEGQYKIDSFAVYTDLFINNSNLFTTDNPENSILMVANDDAGNTMLLKSNKFSDYDLDAFFNDTDIKVISVTYDISMSKETYLDEYAAEIYMLDDEIFNIRLNDSDDNKRGYFYTLNGIKNDFISGVKGSNIVLKLYGSDAYAVKHTTAYTSSKYVVYCLGMLENGNGEVSKSQFSMSLMRNIVNNEIVNNYFFQFYKSPFEFLSVNSDVISNPKANNIPFMFTYKKISDKNNLSFKVRLSTKYQGYPLNKIVMWST